jgi:hypothetical protein
MKYIRGQDGCIYSVGGLKPPCVGHPEGESIWRMSVLTVDGRECIYATYTTENSALLAYKGVGVFMDSPDSMMRFRLGVDGLPDWLEDGVRTISASATAGGPAQTTTDATEEAPE